ncbi:hypothetical protein [Kitasatospora indigofera]|uniref:hypothetical protein n=1 Tax=Kitasatospora indigofera TaxID=67307 RepID=UPI0036A2BA5D
MTDAAIPMPPLPAEREQLLRDLAALTAQCQTTAIVMFEALAPVARALVAQFAELQSALQDAGLLDADGKPTRRPDRPAWQSPYGPPTRRH